MGHSVFTVVWNVSEIPPSTSGSHIWPSIGRRFSSRERSSSSADDATPGGKHASVVTVTPEPTADDVITPRICACSVINDLGGPPSVCSSFSLDVASEYLHLAAHCILVKCRLILEINTSCGNTAYLSYSGYYNKKLSYHRDSARLLTL